MTLDKYNELDEYFIELVNDKLNKKKFKTEVGVEYNRTYNAMHNLDGVHDLFFFTELNSIYDPFEFAKTIKDVSSFMLKEYGLKGNVVNGNLLISENSPIHGKFDDVATPYSVILFFDFSVEHFEQMEEYKQAEQKVFNLKNSNIAVEKFAL